MADPAPHVTPIRADIGKPTAAHQTLWNQIDDRIHQHMSDYLPRMGTVIDNNDGLVTVTMDEEADDRTIPLPRHKGTRHLPGDRVLVQRLQGGDEVISHGISSKQGKDPAVDRNQIFDGAIQRQHIDSNAVGPNELAHSTVQRTHLAPEVTGDISDARNQGVIGQNAAATASGAAATAQAAADDARYRLIGTHGYGDGAEGRITAAQNTANLAYTTANASVGQTNSILDNDIPALKTRLNKLERAAHDAGWAGF
jgi:hypothetical protein